MFGSLILGGMAGGALAFMLFLFTGAKIWSWFLALGVPLGLAVAMAKTNRAMAAGVVLGMAVVLLGFGACMSIGRSMYPAPNG